MIDIVERLRKWSNVVPVPPAADTMGEAAGEIERLRLELSVQKACTVAGREEIARLRLTAVEKPVAWARFFPNGGPMSVFLDRPPADSEPLYRHPLCQDSLQKNLTEAEHDALEFAASTGRVATHDQATLRNLLERLHT